MSRILVTGNDGYIGSVLTEFLIDHGYNVIGFDAGYFADCHVQPARRPNSTIRGDVRDIEGATHSTIDSVIPISDADAIIHLAAISNDPCGEFNPLLTEQINRNATIRLATWAKAMGVKRFIYSSSQSMYGVSDSSNELDEDLSDKNPLTAYARTKWEAECAIKSLADSTFTVVCMRPSTVFGASPNLRCDIVFNNLLACAYTTGRIEVKSDGTPWRPVVHVRDVCLAYVAGLEAPAELVNGRSYNVGIPDGNFTVRQLAEAAQRSVPGSVLTFTGEHGKDSRTYRVSFRRILTELRDYFRPTWNLDCGGAELVAMFRRIGFTEEQFRGRTCNRILQLRHLIDTHVLDNNLRGI